MTSIAVFDPGVTSGFVAAEFARNTPVQVTHKIEIPGGLDGLCDWLSGIHMEVVVCERFRMTPLVRTSEQVEPLRIEGVIRYAFPKVVWQYPDSMLLAGSHHGSPSRNKTAADNVLRTMGLWTLPSEVDNHKDANDINSAMKHLVAYLRNIDHQPTLEALGVT